ncbi:hypothetical protein QYE76_011367 [Lolium multiflorum]|uniref:CCHC-type domain-containing protein n=1 Tax=Lolium multiflorum TaxID=4521 RepID=A0AAD8X3Y2_LOLMU|nr:hypothetical protein QYE76_011367 [Lolium multiflorum]
MVAQHARAEAGAWPARSGEVGPEKGWALTWERYEEETSIARGGEDQLDVKLDMELDMKTSHGRAREEREACARGDAVRSAPGRSDRPRPVPARDEKIVNQKNKNSADVMTWREYEALRNEMRREFRTHDDELRGTIQGISQKLDATSETVTTMKDQMTDIQRSLQVLQLAVDNLTQQEQQEAENPDLQDEAPGVGRGAGRGNRGRGFVELGRHGRGFEEEDGYTTMNELLHHAREAESQLAEEAEVKGPATGAGRYMPRARPSTAPAPYTRSAPYSTPSSKPVSNVSNTKKPQPAASTSSSSMSTARNRDMNCHTCGGKGHFKRDCPNRKVMIINEDNEYESGDDVDPYAPEDDDYDSDGVDAYPSEARTIFVSQRALNVLPSAST